MLDRSDVAAWIGNFRPAGTVGNAACILVAFVCAVVGGAVGWLAWGSGTEVGRLAWILLLPLAWGLAFNRWSASMLIVGYYLVGARGLPGGSTVFFGNGAPVWFGWACWVVSSALLTVPFALLWSEKSGARSWRFAVAVCISAVPPLGLIGWVSPLAVAGVVFPGMEWAGLGLMLGLMMALVRRHWCSVVGLGLAAVLVNAIAVDVPAPLRWRGVDTNFSELSGSGSDDAGQLLATMQRVEWIKRFAETVPANSVRVLPETILGTYDGVTAFALQDIQVALVARGARLLVGAELPQANGQYKNAVIVLGAQGGDSLAAIQGIPVPVSMWKPWAPDGAVADVFGRANIVEVNGMRVGVAICYEQLLPFSLLWTMLSRPNVVVAVSNVWWAKETSISEIQLQTVRAFGRLFGVAVVVSRNV